MSQMMMNQYLWSKGKGRGTHQAFWKGSGKPFEMHHGGRALDAETAMQSTTKVPPAWDPRLEKRGYPFRIWLLDVAMWRIGAEIPEARHGAAVAQRLGGVAKVLARHIPPANLQQGAIIGGVQHNGLEVLLREGWP